MQSTLTACKEVLHVYSFVHQSINTFMQFSSRSLIKIFAARQQQSSILFFNFRYIYSFTLHAIVASCWRQNVQQTTIKFNKQDGEKKFHATALKINFSRWVVQRNEKCSFVDAAKIVLYCNRTLIEVGVVGRKRDGYGKMLESNFIDKWFQIQMQMKICDMWIKLQ